MKGLEISVTNSDLVIKQEERIVKLFVIFKDKKYGTKYVLFTDKTNSHLYFGSPLVNDNKMVIMKFKNSKDEELVKEFAWNYLNEKDISNFELIEVPIIEKLEIIDNNTIEIKEEYINKLNEIFFKSNEEIKNEEIIKEKNNKKGYILFLFIIITAVIVGILYLKNNKELIYGKNIYVQCKKTYNINELNVKSNEVVDLTFSNSQKLKNHEKEIKYSFNDSDIYYEFKEKNLSYKYIIESGEEKYNDNNLEYIMYIKYKQNENKEIPTDYDALFDYYNKNNFICNNVLK